MDAENLLAKASDTFSVRRAFGTAYEKDGLLIIPVALVAGGGGGGTSRSRPRKPAAPSDEPAAPDATAASDATAAEPGAADAGGGFGGVVLPTGAYVVKGDQVRWVPAVDTTIIALAALGLARIFTRAWSRRRRARPR
jgi:uncharacterized spore protein YtfJ